MPGKNKLPKPQDLGLVAAHNALQIFGFSMLAFILGTALLSKRVRRSPNWYLFMTLWLLWCMIFFLLVGQQIGQRPNPAICMMQGVLINAIGAANCWAILSITLEVVFSLLAVLRQRNFQWQHWYNAAIFAMPLLVFLFAFIEELLIAHARPDKLHRRPSGVYCVLKDDRALRITFGLILVALGAVILVKGAIWYLLYRNWATYRRAGGKEKTHHSIPRALIFRVLVFSGLPIIFMVVLGIRLLQKDQDADKYLPVILSDLLPIAAAIIFGTQSDVLDAWKALFRSRPGKAVTPSWEIDKESQTHVAVSLPEALPPARATPI